jgi:hypothetical protein
MEQRQTTISLGSDYGRMTEPLPINQAALVGEQLSWKGLVVNHKSAQIQSSRGLPALRILELLYLPGETVGSVMA